MSRRCCCQPDERPSRWRSTTKRSGQVRSRLIEQRSACPRLRANFSHACRGYEQASRHDRFLFSFFIRTRGGCPPRSRPPRRSRSGQVQGYHNFGRTGAGWATTPGTTRCFQNKASIGRARSTSERLAGGGCSASDKSQISLQEPQPQTLVECVHQKRHKPTNRSWSNMVNQHHMAFDTNALCLQPGRYLNSLL